MKLFIGEILEPSDTEFTLLADSQFVLIRTLWRDKKQSPEKELSPFCFKVEKYAYFLAKSIFVLAIISEAPIVDVFQPSAEHLVEIET